MQNLTRIKFYDEKGKIQSVAAVQETADAVKQAGEVYTTVENLEAKIEDYDAYLEARLHGDILTIRVQDYQGDDGRYYPPTLNLRHLKGYIDRVDWGDGVVEYYRYSVNNANIFHTYPAPIDGVVKTYTCHVYGNIVEILGPADMSGSSTWGGTDSSALMARLPLYSIFIPGTVTRISEGAFRGTNVKYLYISAEVQTVESHICWDNFSEQTVIRDYDGVLQGDYDDTGIARIEQVICMGPTNGWASGWNTWGILYSTFPNGDGRTLVGTYKSPVCKYTDPWTSTFVEERLKLV